jgi:hypothetical protein
MSTQADSTVVLSQAADARVAARARGLSWIDRLTLGAIGLVVVVVTLPVLRGFGLRENENDAMRMLRVLAAEPLAPESALPAYGAVARASAWGGAQAPLSHLAAQDRGIQRRLEDLETLPDGRLRRHGYLFDVVAAGPGEPMLRAWPWEHGQTGRSAFVWTPRHGILGFRNTDGRFSGPDAAPTAADVRAGGWVSMPRR